MKKRHPDRHLTALILAQKLTSGCRCRRCPLQVIAAAVIGGANLAGGGGTALGAIIGACLIEVIRNSLGLLGINAFWQGTFIGGAILFAVLFDRVANYRRNA